MRYTLRALLFIMLSSLLLACGAEDSQQDSIMLKVGTKNVTEIEFSELMERLSENINSFVAQTGSSREQARELLFTEMVNREVFLQDAAREGYGFESKDAEELEAFFKSQVSKPEPTAADLDQLATERGFDSYDEMWADFTKSVTLDNYAKSLTIPGVPQQVNARHILILVDRNTASEAEVEKARKQAEDITKQLRDGADFATLAAEYSGDPGSAASGGELGFQDPSIYVPEFSEAVQKLEIGEISDPVQTDFGFHIIEVLERQGFDSWGGLNSSEQGRAFIDQTVKEYKDNGELQIFIDPEKVPLPASVTEATTP